MKVKCQLTDGSSILILYFFQNQVKYLKQKIQGLDLYNMHDFVRLNLRIHKF